MKEVQRNAAGSLGVSPNCLSSSPLTNGGSRGIGPGGEAEVGYDWIPAFAGMTRWQYGQARGPCPYSDFQAGYEPASTHQAMGRHLSGEHKVLPYNVADSTTGRAEGRSPSAFFLVPLCQRGIKGDWSGVMNGRWATAGFLLSQE
jgi:hypothetical protein